MIAIVIGFFVVAAALFFSAGLGVKKPVLYVPEPDVFDPSNPFHWAFHWEKCPACGSCKITPVKMTRGIIVTHNCIGVPRHSQCQLDGHFATVIEACGAWNRRTEKWIEDRDLTRSK